MPKRGNDFVSVKDALNEMLVTNKLQHGLNEVAVKEAWSAVMGNGVASYTNTIELKKDILIIKLTSSALREELSYGKEKIITLINDYLNKIIITKVRLL